MSAPRRRRRHRGHAEGEEEGNQERWLLTYADMITLLMVLFIVLFAISQVDKQKFAELADGLRHQLNNGGAHPVPGGPGVLDGGQAPTKNNGPFTNPADPLANHPTPTPTPTPSPTPGIDPARAKAIQQQMAKLETAKEEIEKALKARGMEANVHFQLANRGLVVSIVTDKVLFDTAKANIKPQGQAVLNAIIPALKKLPNDISVEGNTDGRVIHSAEFPTNWELSVIRATHVLEYLESKGVDGKRLSATGYGFERPIATNATAAGRSENRRVELVILSSVFTSDENAPAPVVTPAPTTEPQE